MNMQMGTIQRIVLNWVAFEYNVWLATDVAVCMKISRFLLTEIIRNLNVLVASCKTCPVQKRLENLHNSQSYYETI